MGNGVAPTVLWAMGKNEFSILNPIPQREPKATEPIPHHLHKLLTNNH